MKQGNYAFITAESKAQIAKYASENGITASIRYFKGQLKWKNFLDKYVYLLMQYTKQQFL